MKIPLLRIALAVLPLGASISAEDAPDPAAIEILAANAGTFVDAYNNGDAPALAKLFLPDGEIVLANGEIVSGRDGIEAFYTELFSAPARPKAALEAGSVRFLTPALAIEDGTLHVTLPNGVVNSHFYTAVQIKQETGEWLTASIRDEIEDQAPASEKLIALEWMIGDWLIERDGARTFISFSWSDDGPFIDGRALTEQAGISSTSSSYRIGWNPGRRDFVSWAFDARGGFTQSEWTSTDAGWLLRTQGMTADGEANQSTQSIQADASKQSFAIHTRDQTIGGEAMPETTIRVVKRPPTPAVSSTPVPSDSQETRN